MRRVIIVDDEKWIRRGLIQSISWDEWGLSLAGEASDGGEGYDMALTLQPDILFLDMRMPGLDGKQLIGKLNQELPDLLTIVVSGYSDFEYTKEAIRHKAFDYLLKPVKKEELAVVVQKACQELDRRDAERRKASREQGEDWLRQLLHAEESLAEKLVPASWREGEAALFLAHTDRYGDHVEPQRLLPAMQETLSRMQPFLFGGRWQFELIPLQDNGKEWALAISAPKLEPNDMRRLHTSLSHAMAQASGGASFSFGVSRVKRQAGKLGEACHEARKALLRKPLAATGVLQDAELMQPQESRQYPQDQENAFLWVLQSGNRQAAELELERLFAAFTEEPATVAHLQWSADLLLHAMEKQLQAKDARVEDMCGENTLVFAEKIHLRNDRDSMKKLFLEKLLPPLVSYYSQSGEKLGEKAVLELKTWMESNYSQSLSLPQIASSYYLNADYLSRIFKRMTGQNFIDYLTDIRMRKAKELMNKSKYKNYEVAQKVGYEDYRYFSQIFKKKVGMTIGEYRKSIGQADHEGEKQICPSL
ncbi:response regulator transcription factor [Paenibacillus ferrarius]|uniref:response regulator transcription factor n=1 Tax=Paenibacillus ferrarius TaxID=1469647 RepID=UPI003D2845D0